MNDHRPELLLPAGNAEAFFAALEGGADAIYLGLPQFNARNRANNFTSRQIAAIVGLAHRKGIRIYIALNTVIRNFELGQLLDTLHQIKQIGPDGIIIQDLGVLHLIRKHFPDLPLHASTQMAIHNSLGVEFAHQTGFKRVVLARELTGKELESIASKSSIELELFIHGALCYSFSGMCLFSSFLGGASANRGLCTQPCRRIYRQERTNRYNFSLKDNQLIDFLPIFSDLKIASLKIEGRMKPADYVFRVATAYRLALDNHELIGKSKELLASDLGREKTSYFFGREVKQSITQAASAGYLIGKVTKVQPGLVGFVSSFPLEQGCRLRFRNPHNDLQIDLKADQLSADQNQYTLQTSSGEIKQGFEVYLTGNRLKLPSKINTDGISLQERLPIEKARTILNSIKSKNNSGKRQLYIRIDSTDWLSVLPINQLDGIFLQLTSNQWIKLLAQKHWPFGPDTKLMVELPKFIPEARLGFYRELAHTLYQKHLTSFVISHLSQKLLLPQGATFWTNENVYLFNDAAIRYIKSQQAGSYVYPLENDIANLAKGNDRMGIIPLFGFPDLFFSRMPVELNSDLMFSDRSGTNYRKIVREGLTHVLPEHPVSLTQFREKLERFGFYRFLIDLSTIPANFEKFQQIITAYSQSTSIKPSTLFNFKRELK